MFLYVMKNVVTCKEYVGVTTKTVTERFQEHRVSATKKSRRTPLYTAIRKYGIAAFVIETLASYSSFEDLMQAERETIATRGTQVPNGYNVSAGGRGSYGYKVSDQARQRMSAARMGVAPWNKGRPPSQETRDKLTGLKHSRETKERLTAYRRDWWQQQRAAHGEGLLEVLRPQSTRDKLSAMRRQWWADRKARLGDKAAEFLKGRGPRPHDGRPASPAAKKNLSAARRAWWAKRKAEKGDQAADFLRTPAAREKKRAARKRQAQVASGVEGAPSPPKFNFDAEDNTS